MNRNRIVWIISIVIAVVGVAIVFRLLNPLPPTTITFSTGSVEGAYYRYAAEYREHLQVEGFDLALRPGAGSIETLERLIAGEADAGFVQGGTTGSLDVSELRSLGSLYYEPIWVFHREALSVQHLTDFEGLRIAVGEVGSGVYPVAHQLLSDNGITEDNATFVNVPSTVAAEMLADDELDAAFFVIASSASYITNLLNHPDVTLMNFERAAAYEAHYPYMTHVVFHEGTADLVTNVPADDVTLLAVAANLVVRDDIHPNWVRLLSRTISEIHSQPGVFETTNEFPSAAYVTLPLHSEARRYLVSGDTWFEANFPFWLAGVLDRVILLLLPLLTLLYPLWRSLMPFYSLRVRYEITRWYRTLNTIDRQADTLDLEGIGRELETLNKLEKEVTERVNLPFFYMGGVYTLKIHIRLVRTRLEEQRQRVMSEQALTAAENRKGRPIS